MILLLVDSIKVVVVPILPIVVAVGDITGVRELFVSLPNKGGGVSPAMRIMSSPMVDQALNASIVKEETIEEEMDEEKMTSMLK
jgi:hypothetical protein